MSDFARLDYYISSRVSPMINQNRGGDFFSCVAGFDGMREARCPGFEPGAVVPVELLCRPRWHSVVSLGSAYLRGGQQVSARSRRRRRRRQLRRGGA